MKNPVIPALVSAMRLEAQGVLSVELLPGSADTQFPPFEAGAHVDLHLPNGLVRSYSLCNPPSERGRYLIGVLHDQRSRGGSRFVHEALRIGQVIPISAPRNHFALDGGEGRAVLVCGGIGVTPMLAMLHRLRELGRPVELVYCARSREQAAFVQAIEALGSAVSVSWHFDDQRGAPPDLLALLAGRGAQSHYYGCGPAPMLDSFERACRQLGYEHVHLERFSAMAAPPGAPAGGFELVCRKSGRSLDVAADESILDALLKAGVPADHSCREGVCGACETAVLEHDGELDHRDSLLSPAERLSGSTLMVCVSRCSGRRLVLDI